MAKKGSGIYVNSYSSLFANCSNQKENLEKAIVYFIKENGLDNRIDVVKISGAMLFGKKNNCLVIKGDSTFEIVVSCMEIGNFLYVSIYENEKQGLLARMSRKMKSNDVFKSQQKDGMYQSIVACCEMAFVALALTKEG